MNTQLEITTPTPSAYKAIEHMAVVSLADQGKPHRIKGVKHVARVGELVDDPPKQLLKLTGDRHGLDPSEGHKRR